MSCWEVSCIWQWKLTCLHKNQYVGGTSIFCWIWSQSTSTNHWAIWCARLHSLFHQLLECFMILTCFEFILHAFSRLNTRELVVSLSLLLSDRSEMLMFLITYEISLIKFSSSLLFFTMENFDVTIFSSAIGMDTVIGVWLEESYHSGWMEWLLSLLDPLHRNIKSMIEFASPTVSEYLVETWLVRVDKSKLNKSAIIIRSSLMMRKWRVPDTVSNIKVASHN